METQLSFLHMVTNVCDSKVYIQHATLTVDVAHTTHSMHSKANKQESKKILRNIERI